MEEIKKYTCNCESCNREFDENEFEMTQNKDKCILHCDKTIWHKEEDTIIGKQIICDEYLYDKFYSFLLDKYKIYKNKSLRLTNIHFPNNKLKPMFSRLIGNIMPKEIYITECTFYGDEIFSIGDKKFVQFDTINIFKLKSKYDFNIFNSDIKELKIACSDIKSLRIQYCDIEILRIFGSFSSVDYWNLKNIDILSSKIKASFINELDLNYFKIIHGEIETTILENLIIENVDFTKNKFLERLDFIDIRLKKSINLETTFIPEFTSFLGLNFSNNENINVSNRETARKIKDSYEKQNNIIEANKFYALEMKEREKELDLKKDFFEWIVFKIHGLVSNHSQDWVLVLFWIISLTFITSFIKIIDSNISQLTEKIILSFIVTVIVFFININISNTKKIYYIICSLVYYILYSIFTKDFALNIFSNTINPFSIMTGKEELTFGILLYKITIAYLIYQLIVSIRQNTRRK